MLDMLYAPVAWMFSDLPNPIPDHYAVHTRYSRRKAARLMLLGDAPGRRSARPVAVAFDAGFGDEVQRDPSVPEQRIVAVDFDAGSDKGHR